MTQRTPLLPLRSKSHQGAGGRTCHHEHPERCGRAVCRGKDPEKQVKDDSAALRQRTKSVIEHLTDEEVRDLLHRKWILPLMENLNSLPDAVLDDFVKQLDVVCKKYETTFEDVESQIASTEHELLGLLDDLQGNEFDMKGIAELKKLLGGE